MTAENPGSLKARAVEAFRSALEAVRPDTLVAQALRREGRFRNHRWLAGLMEDEGPVYVFACGKAAPGMLNAALAVLGERTVSALCIAPGPRPAGLPAAVEWLESEHPLPGPLSEKAGRRALGWIRALPPDGEAPAGLLALLSGGTSALLGSPCEGTTMAELAAVTELLLKSGANIREINTVRKHLCPALGGGLLRALPEAVEPLVLLLSDVPGNDLTTIGSGPFIPDPTSLEDVRTVLRSCRLEDRLPGSVSRLIFDSGPSNLPETLKPGERPTPPHLVLADNTQLLRELERQFADARYSRVIGVNEQIPVEDAVRIHLAEAEKIRSEVNEGPVVLVSGGELSVNVTGQGRGGRNTHYALTFLSEAERLRLGPWVLLSAGSDGRDGPTSAAGAVTCSRSIERAKAMGLDPARYLEGSDSCSFFEKLDELVMTGPTGNNLNDVRVVILA